MPWRDHVDRQLILFVGSATLGLAALVALQQMTTPKRTTRSAHHGHRDATAAGAPRHGSSPNAPLVARSHTVSRSRPSSAVVRSQSRRREIASPPPHPPPSHRVSTSTTTAAAAVAEPAPAATEPLTVQSLHRHRQRVHGDAMTTATTTVEGVMPDVPPLTRLAGETHTSLTRDGVGAAMSPLSPRDEPHTTRMHLDAAQTDQAVSHMCTAGLSKCPCVKACQTDVRWFSRGQGTQTEAKELPQPSFTPERLPYFSGAVTTPAAYAAAPASPLDELPSPIAPPSFVNTSQPLLGEMIGLASPLRPQSGEEAGCGRIRSASDMIPYRAPVGDTVALAGATAAMPRYLVHEVKLQVTLLIDDICTRPMQLEAWHNLTHYLEQLPMTTVTAVMQLPSVTDFAHALPMLQLDMAGSAEEQLLYNVQLQVRSRLHSAVAAPDTSATTQPPPQHTSCDESSTTLRRRRRFVNITVASESDEEQQEAAVEREVAVRPVRALCSADMSTLVDGEATVARVARLVRAHHYLQMRTADTQTQASDEDYEDAVDGGAARHISSSAAVLAAKSLHDASCQTERSAAGEKNGVTATLAEEGDEATVAKDALSASGAAAALLLDLVRLRRSEDFVGFRRLPGCAAFACDLLDLALRAEELLPRLTGSVRGGGGDNAAQALRPHVDVAECDRDSLQADERAALAVQRALINDGASFDLSTPERTDAREHTWPGMTRDSPIHTPPPLRKHGHRARGPHTALARRGGVHRPASTPSATRATGVAVVGATPGIFARPRTLPPRAMAT